MRIRYIIRRLLYLIPLFLGILLIVFVAIRAAGDPIDLMLDRLPGLTEEDRNNIARYYGLDQPLHIQFFSFLSRLFQGDLGKSYHVSAGTDVVIHKGVHRCRHRGYVELIISGLDPPGILNASSVPFLGFTSDQLRDWAREAGASRVTFFGDYQRNPYDAANSTDLIAVIERDAAVTT